MTEIRNKLNQLIASYGEGNVSRQQKGKQADCDKTRENSLSPEEYLGLHEAKDLALRATVRPITPPDQSPPPHRRLASTGTPIELLPSSADDFGAPQPDVEESLPAISLAAILAADFHSADASERKEIRKRAKQENVVAAFEEEIRRIGILARTLT